MNLENIVKKETPLLNQSHQISKVIVKPKHNITKKEENVKLEALNFTFNMNKSLHLRTSTPSIQKSTKKRGEFQKHQAQCIKSHNGTTLNDAKFLVEWKVVGQQKIQDSYQSYNEIVKYNPEILLNYFEKNDQYIIMS